MRGLKMGKAFVLAVIFITTFMVGSAVAGGFDVKVEAKSGGYLSFKLPNASVKLIKVDNPSVVKSGTTNKKGRVRIHTPGENGKYRIEVTGNTNFGKCSGTVTAKSGKIGHKNVKVICRL